MYLEVFPKIAPTGSEKRLTGTYSYWIFLGDVAKEPGTNEPAYDTVLFEVFSNTQNTNATSDIEYLDYTDSVFVPSGKFDCAEDGETSWKKLVNNGGENDQGVALARRGFTWSDASRFLTESQVLALEENRVKVYRPVSSTSFGPRAFNNGYFFVNGQYDQTPAISENFTRSDGEVFNYVVYPKVCANLPDLIFDTDGTVWFDFSVNFPSSITLSYSGTGSILFRKGQNINDPIVRSSVGISFNATYEKVVVENTILRTSVVKYVKTDQSGEELDGGFTLISNRASFTIQWEGPDGPYTNTYRVGLKAKAPDVIFGQQNRYNNRTDIFGTSAFNYVPGLEYIYERKGARLNKNFSQNVDACYLYCANCEGTQEGVTYNKTPFNSDGTGTKTKNRNAWHSRFPYGNYFVPPLTNPPYEIEDENSTGGEIPSISDPLIVGWGPQISWSNDAGTAVSLGIEDGKYPNGPDAFYPDLPDLRCTSFIEGGGTGAVDFFVAISGGGPLGEGADPQDQEREIQVPVSFFADNVS